MTTSHIRIECSCGGTEFRGRIEPAFKLRYTADELAVYAVPWAPSPTDIYCVTCGAAEWNIESCSAETIAVLAQVFAEMATAVDKSHQDSIAQLIQQRGDQ